MATEDGAGPGRLRAGHWPNSEDDTETVVMQRITISSRLDPLDDRETYRGQRRLPERRWGLRLMVLGLIGVTALAVALRLAFGGGADDRVPLAEDTIPASLVAPPANELIATTSGGPSRSVSAAPSSRSSGTAPKVPQTASAAPSASSPPPPPAGSLVAGAALCAEVPGGSNADGTQIRMAACTGATAQRWTRDGETVRTLGKCLDVRGSGKTNGTPVQLFQCNNSSAQIWEIRADGTWRNPQSNRCLNIDGSTSEPGGALVIRDCAVVPAQIFRLA